jgi:hypothetical protein
MLAWRCCVARCPESLAAKPLLRIWCEMRVPCSVRRDRAARPSGSWFSIARSSAISVRSSLALCVSWCTGLCQPNTSSDPSTESFTDCRNASPVLRRSLQCDGAHVRLCDLSIVRPLCTDAAPLAELVRSHPAIKSLGLRYNGITPAGALSVLAVVHFQTCLCCLCCVPVVLQRAVRAVSLAISVVKS